MQADTTTAITTRPTFLTVLCILSFLGSSWGIITGTISYLTANTASELTKVSMQDSQEKLDSMGGSKLAEKIMADAQASTSPENLKKMGLVTIISSVITLLGAILMFGLKKSGFWLYLLGSVIAIVMPIVIYGAGSLVSIVSVLGAAFIGVLFVILYGLNLKYLK